MVDRLGDRFEFHVITRNHDGGDPTPYTTVQANAWNSVGNARVYYGEPQKVDAFRLAQLGARGRSRCGLPEQLFRPDVDEVFCSSAAWAKCPGSR